MSRCGSCGAEVTWAVTTGGRRMPVDASPVDGGNVELHPSVEPGSAPTAVVLSQAEAAQAPLTGEVPRYTSHFATCPHADTHRRSR